MKKSELFEQIEAYLNQTLSVAELEAFEARLAEDEALRREVALHRQMQRDFDPARLELRNKLKALMEEPLPSDMPRAAGGIRVWPAVLGLLLLAILAWFLFQPKQKPTSTIPAPPGLETTPLQAPDTATSLPPKKEPQPIAKADPARFRPNPGMEAFVESRMRSEMIAVQWLRPENGKRFVRKNGQTRVDFAGAIQWDENQHKNTFVLSCFDNRNANTPLLTFDIVPNKSRADGFDFELSKSLNLPPGLYYFTLEEKDKGEVLYAGKFLITE